MTKAAQSNQPPTMLIRTADCPPQPWKNGGGVTRELLTWPLGTKGTDDWQLRISVADITQDGAFSAFEGIARAFAVIEGAGVQLQLGGTWHSVRADTEPVQFAGSDAPDCKLINGATRDLNVMWKNGHAAKLVRAYAGDAPVGIGFFSLQEMTLYWQEIPAISNVKTGEHIGWWIDYL